MWYIIVPNMSNITSGVFMWFSRRCCLMNLFFCLCLPQKVSEWLKWKGPYLGPTCLFAFAHLRNTSKFLDS